MTEWSRYDAYPQLDGLERLRASFRSHSFVRHAHDYYVIGLIQHGVQSFEQGRRRYITPDGGLCIINPGEMHTGQAATDKGFEYQAIYPSAALMQRIVGEVSGNAQLPWFDAAVVTEPDLVAPMLRLHHALDVSASRLEHETLLFAALTALVSRYTSPRPILKKPHNEQPMALCMRDYLEERYSENVTLEQIAQTTSLSPWHAARVFQQAYGIPPHAYLEGVRISRARELLKQGQPIAWVALATGFVDQSHFTRRFKRHLGVTPGKYVQHHKEVQDNAISS